MIHLPPPTTHTARGASPAARCSNPLPARLLALPASDLALPARPASFLSTVTTPLHALPHHPSPIVPTRLHPFPSGPVIVVALEPMPGSAAAGGGAAAPATMPMVAAASPAVRLRRIRERVEAAGLCDERADSGWAGG